MGPAVVNPETVGQRVKLLRQALGDDRRAPRYVFGVRGKGYRIDVPVTRGLHDFAPEPTQEKQAQAPVIPRGRPRWPLSGRQRLALVVATFASLGCAWYLIHSAPSWDWARNTAKPRLGESSRTPDQPQAGPSLAVLPFIDLSPRHDQQYFSDGLAEEVLNKLAQLPVLRVVSGTSFRGWSDDLRRIGELLNVCVLAQQVRGGRRDRVQSGAQPVGSLDAAIGNAVRLLDENPQLARGRAEEILPVFPLHPIALLPRSGSTLLEQITK